VISINSSASVTVSAPTTLPVLSPVFIRDNSFAAARIVSGNHQTGSVCRSRSRLQPATSPSGFTIALATT
jgi:hypothetical protein